MAAVLGCDRGVLVVTDPPLSSAQADRFADLAGRRAEGEPVAYLVGTRGFRWLELSVDPRVLIPRPETEHLVEAALRLPSGIRVVDVGTGSGAVALALKSERPDLQVVGTDVSHDALEVARKNGARLGLAVEWVEGDLLAAVAGPVDAVVANLPYVADGEEPPFEPALALRGGRDGLDVIRRLLDQAACPFLALEIGAGQAPGVALLCHRAGFGRTETHPDLAGIDRVVVARR